MYDWRRFAKFLHSNSGKVRDDNEKLGGGRKKSLVTTYVARKGPKVRGPDKKNSGC